MQPLALFVFAHACRLGAEGIVSMRVGAAIGPAVPGLDGPQSRKFRGAAGAQRELEQVIAGGRGPNPGTVAGPDAVPYTSRPSRLIAMPLEHG
jgi:hypothetical protein